MPLILHSDIFTEKTASPKSFLDFSSFNLQLSLADLDAATYLTDMVARVPGLKVTEPKLLAHVNRILETPALSQWLKKRPQTPF